MCLILRCSHHFSPCWGATDGRTLPLAAHRRPRGTTSETTAGSGKRWPKSRRFAQLHPPKFAFLGQRAVCHSKRVSEIRRPHATRGHLLLALQLHLPCLGP